MIGGSGGEVWRMEVQVERFCDRGFKGKSWVVVRSGGGLGDLKFRLRCWMIISSCVRRWVIGGLDLRVG